MLRYPFRLTYKFIVRLAKVALYMQCTAVWSTGMSVDHLHGSNLTVSHNTITSDSMSSGGGFAAWYSSTLRDSHVSHNKVTGTSYAVGAGGQLGIDWFESFDIWESVTVEGNIIVLNSNSTNGNPAEGAGAGLHTPRPILLKRCDIRDNRILLGAAEPSIVATLTGGGVFIYDAVTLIDCNVTSNHIIARPTVAMTVTAQGGGICSGLYPWAQSSSALLLVRSSALQNNSVSLGGLCAVDSLAQGGGKHC
jgi:hypothetical protein